MNDIHFIPSFFLDASHLNPNDVFDTPDEGKIAAVLCHFNPCLYESPVRNLKNVLRWLLTEKIPTYAVELRCGRSQQVSPILPMGHRKVIQLQSHSTIFRKDNLWNIAASILPNHFEYVLCIDADTLLLGERWQNNLLRELLKNKIVQPFSRALWTDSIGQSFKEKESCGFAYCNNLPKPQISKGFHSGFAIALHRDFWNRTSGFYNSPVGGGSLFLMSAIMGLENELEASLSEICPPFLEHYRLWAKSVYAWSEGRFGYIDCQALHLWHGSRKKRRYLERFERLKTFDPNKDICFVGEQGLYDWSPEAIASKADLVQSVEDYFYSREEDEWFVSSKEV